MWQRIVRSFLGHPWLRIAAAAVLLITGLAPIGAPIISDDSWRRAVAPVAAATPAQPFQYRFEATEKGSNVQRSADGGLTWHNVAGLPVPVLQLVAAPGNEQIVYAQGDSTVWVSVDGGTSWEQTAALPSRPQSIVVTENTGSVFVGTESMGLLRSSNRGESWETVGGMVLSDGTAPVSVTALAADPFDGQIVYAATAVWLGTSTARLTPVGIYASVDGGQSWFQMAQLSFDTPVIVQLESVAGRPLAVHATNALGRRAIQLALTPAVLAGLSSPVAAERAAAARAAGLIGDPAALGTLEEHLGDPDVLAGERIAEAIGRLGSRKPIPGLVAALSQDSEAVQARAARALGMLKAPEAVPGLVDVLRSGQPMAQRAASVALAAIGTPESLRPLVDALDTPADGAIRHAALRGLEVAGTRAIEPLTEALQQATPAVRAGAAEALGYIRSPAAASDLATALADPEPAVRTQAVWALGEIGGPQALDALRVAAALEQSAEVQVSARAALERAESTGPVASSDAGSRLEDLMIALGEIPPTRWTLLALVTALAALLLWAHPSIGNAESGKQHPSG